MKSRGFTLTEILIVLSIIGLMTAIALPVFQRVRESARRTTCQSNLKQIGLGFLQYVQDWNNKLPPAGTPPHALDQHEFSRIGIYLKSNQVLICPSDVIKPTDDSAMTIKSGSTWFYCSYLTTFSGDALHPFVEDVPSSIANRWGLFSYRGIDMADIPVPTETIAATEGMLTPSSASGMISHIHPANATPNGPGSSFASNYVTRRHNQGANYLFADGHVKWFQRALARPDRANENDQTGANATVYGVRDYYFWRNGVNHKD